MYTIAPDPLRLPSVTSLLPLLFYQGLFVLPEDVPINARQVLWLLHLPNPPQCCVIDLQDRRLHRPEGVALSDEHPPPCCAYPWRRSRKVKRLLASSAYACVVRDTPEAIQTSLQRAAAYHVERHGSTWLLDDYITALSHVQGLAGRVPDAPAGTNTVRVLVIEMVERTSGTVVAGCCGFALGCVYHDFTMYTMNRTAATLGAVLTKLIGEALQRCGYNLWYWGIFISYMEQFRALYGLKELDREAFHTRWDHYRDVQPSECIDTFLKRGGAMLPYFSTS
ncbi:hypothetical protein STCU_07033 [Strigomonas culicis]|uniref:Leucyl/phenylalanyl-tRNA protein transferase n=1 Tax=Strigomonas culicis TaxID=28005 RepID=S9VCL6_9TRYP|nr:hypothetical protein STCU_07033 [Strigomonas culicis]|eukprot:EPY24731.1 hypothetical protein STCU_07033 [Strigomonas culicis]